MKEIAQTRITETQRYTIIGVVFGLLFPVIATIIRILNFNFHLTISSVWKVQSSDPLLWIIDTAPLFLGFFAFLAGRRQENSQKLTAALKKRESELEAIQINLEQRVEERTAKLAENTKQLQKRAYQLEAIAATARTAAFAQNMESLLASITSEISSNLGFYHVGIFLLDSNKEFAILSAANSEGGQNMLARGHRLRVGEQGIVGFVAARGLPRTASDVGADSIFFNNPDLPETHSEISLPLKFGADIIGVLDIQSTEPNVFSEEEAEIFSILADQVAVAIRNTRSLEESKRALKELEFASRQTTAQAWEEFAKNIRIRGYRYDGIKPEPLKDSSRSVESKDALVIPVQLRGQTLGRLRLRATENSRKWTEDELAIINSTAERVAIALEGARLLDDAQKRASRETFLSEMATKLGASFQIDSILRDTVEELGNALKDSKVTFQLVNPSTIAPAEKDNGASGSRRKSD